MSERVLRSVDDNFVVSDVERHPDFGEYSRTQVLISDIGRLLYDAFEKAADSIAQTRRRLKDGSL